MIAIPFSRGVAIVWLCVLLGINAAIAADDWNCRPGQTGSQWDCGARPSRPAQASAGGAATRPPATSAAAAASAPPQASRLVVRKPAEVAHVAVPQARSGITDTASGWNCRKGDEEKEWKCTLAGPDPRGETHVVREPGEEVENWAEQTDITDEDEKRFRSLMSTFPSNPWLLHCGKREEYRGSDFLVSPADRRARERAPVEIRSDFGELQGDELANFSGAAQVMRADQTLSADFISRNAYADTMNANGAMTYAEKGLAFSSDSGFLDLGKDKAVLRNSQFVLSTVPARGTSRLTYFDSKDLSRYEQFAYTSCPPGNRDWILHADKVKINKATGQGSGTHAWMEFKGVPLFYTPYMSFPTDDRRQTGLLAPSFGYSSVRGFDLTVPYYFNLAPNYDLTVWPRLLTERGVLLHGDFRYMTPYNQGRFIGEILPDDWETHKTRGELGLLDNAFWTENLRSHLDLNYVSDQQYLNQLSNQLALIDFNYVRSNASVTYTGENYGITTSADYFQTINPLISQEQRPFYRLPSTSFFHGLTIADTGLNLTTNAELVNFVSDVNPAGQRFNLKPRLQYPLRSAAGFVTPSVTFQLTQYMMDNLTNPNDPADNTKQNQQVVSSNLTRALPIVSLDSGLFFERDLDMGKAGYTHTIEPRLFYVYIPYQNQDQFPLYDTINYDFNYYQLFRENRFTGNDRLGDTNQLTFALTSRMSDLASGRDRLRATIGEIFYFQGRRVTLPISNQGTVFYPDQATTFSNLMGDFTAALSDRWWVDVGGQYNPYDNQFERRQISLRYDAHNNDLLNLTYLYLNQPSNQSFQVNLLDGSMRLPIAEGWHVIGRWQYSLLDQITLEAFGGIERETCCWRLSVVGRHYINSVNGVSGTDSFTSTANNGVFMQFEFKGLTRLGDQLEKLLTRSIRGYRTPEQ